MLKMAENGLKIQPVPNHVCLGGRREGILFMEFGFRHAYVKKGVKINFSLLTNSLYIMECLPI